MSSPAELAVSYAALILADDGVDITVWWSGSNHENFANIFRSGRQATIPNYCCQG